jgi:hypothetical protein
MPQGNRKCEKCDFYEQNSNFIPFDKREISYSHTCAEFTFYEGLCCRYPPKKYCDYSYVYPDCWCGEFRGVEDETYQCCSVTQCFGKAVKGSNPPLCKAHTTGL